MSNGVRDQSSNQKRVIKGLIKNEEQFIQSLRVFANTSTFAAQGVTGGEINNSPVDASGNYLQKSGDFMVGQLGRNYDNVFPNFIDEGVLDVSKTNGITDPVIILQGQGGGPDELTQIIQGEDVYPFQELVLRVRLHPITFQQTALPGNITTPGGQDLVVPKDNLVFLYWDNLLQRWVVTANSNAVSGGIPFGGYILARLLADQTSNLDPIMGHHVEFDTVEQSDTQISVSAGGGQASGLFSGFIPGHVYECTAYLVAFAAGGMPVPRWVTTKWYDDDKGTVFGGQAFSTEDPSFAGSQFVARGYLVADENTTTIRLQLQAINNIDTIQGDDMTNMPHTYCSIVDITATGSGGGSTEIPQSAWHEPVRARPQADIPDLDNMPEVQDGITLVFGNRVLLTEQTNAAENGIYDVGIVAANVAPLTRSFDLDSDEELVSEIFVAIEEGTVSKNKVYHLITNNPLTIGFTNQLWEEFGGATSLGPDLGQDDEGFDASGQFVFDGRISTANFVTQIWESITVPEGANNGYKKIIWIPPFGERAGRLVIVGDQAGAGTRNSAYSDDLGDNFIDTSGIDTEDVWGVLAYDPTGRTGTIGGPHGVLVAAVTNSSVMSTVRNLKSSSDRGASWNTVITPNTDWHRDLIWAQDPTTPQFVITNYTTGGPPASQNRGIWTSPDGSVWTIRTTPIPLGINQSWSYIAYSPSLDLYVATTLGQNFGPTDVMTSSDGITWALHATNIPVFSIRRIIWSEGQQKFVMLSVDLSTRTIYSNTSVDGINWEQHFVAQSHSGSAITANDIVYANNLSTYVICGKRETTGHRFEKFWVSQDAENWMEVAKIPDETNTARLVSIVYSEEYTKFFAINNDTGIGSLFRTIR